MWNAIYSYMPGWTVYLQAAIAFIVPFAIFKLFQWIRDKEEE